MVGFHDRVRLNGGDVAVATTPNRYARTTDNRWRPDVPKHHITKLEQLAELYRAPSKRVSTKQTQTIDEVTARFLHASPFFLLATADEAGRCDVSPRGGPPGQLVVLDERRVAFPDLNGNNLVDSLRNIIANPHAGLLIITPGNDETLRLNGTATLTTDPDVLSLWDGELRRPKLAIVITLEDAFFHCAKSFRRAELWEPESWMRFADLPDPVTMLQAHTNGEDDPATARAGLEDSYRADLEQDQPPS